MIGAVSTTIKRALRRLQGRSYQVKGLAKFWIWTRYVEKRHHSKLDMPTFMRRNLRHLRVYPRIGAAEIGVVPVASLMDQWDKFPLWKKVIVGC